MGGWALPIKFNFNCGNVNKTTAYIINSQIQNNNPVLTDMDANKGRFEEVFAVVTTVYKSTSPMDFVAVLRRGTALVYDSELVLHYH